MYIHVVWQVLNVKQADGSYAMEEVPKGVGAFWGFAKLWAVPKMLVPLGVDELGRPVSCTCWGRSALCLFRCLSLVALCDSLSLSLSLWAGPFRARACTTMSL